MRKPRDFDAELKTLSERTRQLKERKVLQLGELVIATGADALDAETLAGALLKTMEVADAPRQEAWRKRGAAFFQGSPRKAARGSGSNDSGTQATGSGAAST